MWKVLNRIADITPTAEKILINADEPHNYLGILLDEGMVDFDKPVAVRSRYRDIEQMNFSPSKNVQREFLRCRGDRGLDFSAIIVFEEEGCGKWVVYASSLSKPSPSVAPAFTLNEFLG